MKSLVLLTMAASLAGCAGNHWHGDVRYVDGDELNEDPPTFQERVTEVFNISDVETIPTLEECTRGEVIVTDVNLRGSFTMKGADQVITSKSRVECGGDGKTESAMLDDLELQVPGVLVRTTDIDGDGLDEVLSVERFCRGRSCGARFYLAKIDGGGLRILLTGEAYDTDCGARGGRESWKTVSVKLERSGNLRTKATQHWRECRGASLP